MKTLIEPAERLRGLLQSVNELSTESLAVPSWLELVEPRCEIFPHRLGHDFERVSMRVEPSLIRCRIVHLERGLRVLEELASRVFGFLEGGQILLEDFAHDTVAENGKGAALETGVEPESRQGGAGLLEP